MLIQFGKKFFFTVLLFPTLSFGQITLILQPTNSTCGYPNGAIFSIANGGQEPYFFSDNGGIFQNNGLFTGLASGNHKIVVRDSLGNTTAASVTIVNKYQHPTISITGEISPTSCSTLDGEITLGAIGGLPNYQFSVDGFNFQSNGIFTNLSSGTYLLSIIDANHCNVNKQFSFANTCSVGISYDYSKTVCSSDGYITVNPDQNSPFSFTYSLDNKTYQSSNTFKSLSSGSYHTYVKNGSGLISVNSLIIFHHCDLQLLAISAPSRCLKSDGTITVTVQGQAELYYYSISGKNYKESKIIKGLAPGSYTVIVKDALGNIGSLSNIVVGQYCPVLTVSSTPSACTSNTGTITVTNASGGTDPVLFSIDGNNFQLSKIFTALAAGNYTVTSKDAANILTTAKTTVSTANGPTLNAAPTAAGCTVANGTITATTTGGLAPFKFQLNNGAAKPSGLFAGLASGDYNLKVTDANGCSAQQTVTVSVATGLALGASTTDAGCSISNGTITALASGGPAPYNYQLNNGAFQPSGNFASLAAGNYNLIVRDANGCTASQPLQISTVDGPNITATSTEAGCTIANGTITAIATDGTLPYSFQLDNGTAQPTGNFAALASGNYAAWVTDANGCTAEQDITVPTTPSGPSLTVYANAASCANNDGSINASATGLAPPLLFSINNGPLLADGNFTGLSSKNYGIKVMDANGCSAIQTVNVPINNSIQLDAGPARSLCAGSAVTLSASSSSANYAWSPAAGLSDIHSLNPTATPASTTLYYLSASSGICTAVDSVLLTVNPLPVASAGNNDSTCYAENILLTGSGGTAFSWSPPDFLDDTRAQNPTLIRPTQTTTYSLSVTDNNGCRSASPATVTITVTPEARVFAGNDTSVLANSLFPLNAVDVNSSGFIYYEWSPADGLDNPSAPNPNAQLSQATTYTVTASTGNQCSAKDDIHISVYKSSDILVPNGFTPNNDGLNDVLRPLTLGIRDFHYFRVFNRWGQTVFVTRDPGQGWNGQVAGQDQELSTYIWEAEGVDFNGNLIRRKGTVVLIK